MSHTTDTDAIVLKRVSKSFSYKTHKGLKGFFSPDKKEIKAVDDISLTIKRGETVAFIGPNGAGKSTTIKMLSGILQPSKGTVSVLGLEPIRERRELAMRIGTVFGQRSQLIFNLPLTDSFRLTAKMYRIPNAEANARVATLIEQFRLDEFIDQPVRKLSLGQRMRAEVANALLHNPDIIFLDEPTIGLDVVAKRALRETIKKVNKERATTVFLTSHDVGDIEEVCARTMIVNHGKIVLDAKTTELKRLYLHDKTVAVIPSSDIVASLPVIEGVTPVAQKGRLLYQVNTKKLPLKQFLQSLLKKIDIADLTIEDMPLEDVIHEMYTKAA
jgi:ABC-2 type transport system ATP-binding protein